MNRTNYNISIGLNFVLTLILIYVLNFNNEDFDKEYVKKEVTEFLNKYQNTVNENGVTAEFAFLDTTENFYWVPPSFDSYIEIDSVRTILYQTSETETNQKYSYTYLKVDPLSKDITTYTSKIKVVPSDPLHDSEAFSMLETGVIVKRNGNWKILSGQSRLIN